MTIPCVTVLIPTFNRAHYVANAVRSALGQTLTDLEVVVVDDGSTDDTANVLGQFADTRLRIVRHDRNRGIPETRNTALSAATGRYIAWLDSDDSARPTRLSEQVAFLDDNPTVAMVGACAGKLGPDGTPMRGVRVPPLSAPMIEAWLLFRSAFQQSSVMGRAEVLTRYRYDPAYPVCEDVDMFLRLQRDNRLANLPRILIDRRLHSEQSVRNRQGEIDERTASLVLPLLERLGLDSSPDDVRRHTLLGKAKLRDSEVAPDFLMWAKDWLLKIRTANARTGVMDEQALSLACDYFWLLACRAMMPRIGKPAALRAMLGRPPAGLWTPVAYGWMKAALPVYLGR